MSEADQRELSNKPGTQVICELAPVLAAGTYVLKFRSRNGPVEKRFTVQAGAQTSEEIVDAPEPPLALAHGWVLSLLGGHSGTLTRVGKPLRD